MFCNHCYDLMQKNMFISVFSVRLFVYSREIQYGAGVPLSETLTLPRRRMTSIFTLQAYTQNCDWGKLGSTSKAAYARVATPGSRLTRRNRTRRSVVISFCGALYFTLLESSVFPTDTSHTYLWMDASDAAVDAPAGWRGDPRGTPQEEPIVAGHSTR
jgi:hypothetical protein